MNDFHTVRFRLGNMIFEYDDDKNRINLDKHGISLKNAALVFFDYNRIEYYDETHSDMGEDRYSIIGYADQSKIGVAGKGSILFVVYTESLVPMEL